MLLPFLGQHSQQVCLLLLIPVLVLFLPPQSTISPSLSPHTIAPMAKTKVPETAKTKVPGHIGVFTSCGYTGRLTLMFGAPEACTDCSPSF
jgi:hypothetical protein